MTTSTTTERRRVVPGLSLIVAPALLVLGSALRVETDGMDTSDRLAHLAASNVTAVLGNALLFVAPFVLIPGVVGLVTLFHRRGSWFGEICASVVLVAWLTHSTFFFQIIAEYENAQPGVDTEQAVQFLDRMHESALALPLYLTFWLGFQFGTILLAIPLWRTRIVPWWAAISVAASGIALAFGETKIVDMVSFGLLAVGFGAVGATMLARSRTGTYAVPSDCSRGSSDHQYRSRTPG